MKHYLKNFIRQYIKAMRLLSLTLAFGATSSGIAAAWRSGYIRFSPETGLQLPGQSGAGVIAMLAGGSQAIAENPLDLFFPSALELILLVTVAGLAVQTGANLINDYFEGSFKYRQPGRPVRRRGQVIAGQGTGKTADGLSDFPEPGSENDPHRIRFLGRERTVFDVFVFVSGIGFMALSALIGLYLVIYCGMPMFWIGAAGVFGSYAYTGEPFVYKRRGLGAIISWILMGPLMCLGAWYPFAGHLSWLPVLVGLPLSFLVPALMISNEMRDFFRDERIAAGTLSNRIGLKASRILYSVLVSASFISAAVLTIVRVLPVAYLAVLILIPIALRARKAVHAHDPAGIPWTNHLHLSFMIISLFVLFIV